MCKSANKKQECPRIEENGQFSELKRFHLCDTIADTGSADGSVCKNQEWMGVSFAIRKHLHVDLMLCYMEVKLCQVNREE